MAVVLILCIAELIRSNTYIQTENITFSSGNIPESFNNCKIVQISDYHNQGSNFRKRLISIIDSIDPDYIFLTGDISDSFCTDIDAADDFLEEISETAPCYLVWGNHDYRIDSRLLDKMRGCADKNNIVVLEDDFTYISRGTDKVLITGTVSDPSSDAARSMLDRYPHEDAFSVWLHHYPEDFEKITDLSRVNGCQADLVFCGHAHGGLIRFPFIKGLYAPGQGFFPEYTRGSYEYKGTQMIVSAGVGNSSITKRFLDPFHLVVCTLEKT